MGDRRQPGQRTPAGTSAADVPGSPDELVGEEALSKLRWRCRRGLLENDLFIERFFSRYADRLTVRQARGLSSLMELDDNDLLDLLLRRREPEGDINTSEVRQVLGMLRTRGASPDVGT
jgi:antitoxin CptB